MIKYITAILVFISMSYEFNAQSRQAWRIANKIGVTTGLNENGTGQYYGFSIERDLGFGISALGEYSSGFFTKNLNQSSFESMNLTDIDGVNYRNYFIGIKKYLQVAERSTISLGFNAGISSIDKLLREAQNNTNLDANLQRILMGSEQALSYQIVGEYNIVINESISGGLFTSYQSEPNNVQFGLRSYILLNPIDDSTEYSDKLSPWWMEWAIGAFGGDGTPTLTNVDIYFGRYLTNSLSAYLRLSVGNRTITDEFITSSLSTEDLSEFGRQFLINDEDQGSGVPLINTSASYAVGIKYIINQSTKSKLHASLGLSYFTSNVVSPGSFGSSLEQISYNASEFKEILADIGIHYDYTISEKFYVGAKVTLAFGRLNIGAAFHTGVRF
jgi:hypothetical protein